MQYFEIALFVKFSALRLAAIRDKWRRIIAAQIEEKLNWWVHIFPLTIQNDKNTNGISDLISDAVFGFSYLTYLGSGFSSIWAAIMRLYLSRIAAKRKCYREECVTNQFKYRRDISRNLPFPQGGGRGGFGYL